MSKKYESLNKIRAAYIQWCGSQLPEDATTLDKIHDSISSEIQRQQEGIAEEGHLLYEVISKLLE